MKSNIQLALTYLKEKGSIRNLGVLGSKSPKIFYVNYFGVFNHKMMELI